MDGAHHRANRKFFALAPVLIALAVHAPVLSHRLLWDDGTIIERQLPALSLVRAFAPPPGINQWTYVYYRPLTTLTLVIDRALYGSEPFGYHLTVWLLHAAATLAVSLLALRLLSPAYALLGASLFAVYPLHPECVGWIAGRTDILATLFAVLASWVHFRAVGVQDFRSWRAQVPIDDKPGGNETSTSPVGARRGGYGPRSPGSGSPESPSPGKSGLGTAESTALSFRAAPRISPAAHSSTFLLAALLSSAFLLAALLSKESAIALAPVLLLSLLLARVPYRPRLLAAAGVIAPILIYLGMRAALNPKPPPPASTSGTAAIETESADPPGSRQSPVDDSVSKRASSGAARPRGGSRSSEASDDGPVASKSETQRLARALSTAFWAFAYMPQRLVFPIMRSPYIEAPPRGTLRGAVSFPLVLLGAWTFVAAVKQKRTGIIFALLLIGSSFATTALAASMSPTRTPVADRYFYMPAVGWCLLVAGLLAWLGEGIPLESKVGGAARKWSFAAGWILVVVFATMTLIRTPTYASKRSFWSEAVRQDPASGAATLNLGNALAQEGALGAAQDAYKRALDLPLADADRALTLTSFGAVLYAEGNLTGAEPILRRAASMPGAGSMETFNLGALLFQIGLRRIQDGDMAGAGASFVEAIVHLERAVQQDPFFAKAWLLLGDSYVNTGRPDEARRAWRRVIELDGAQGPVGREASDQLARPSP